MSQCHKIRKTEAARKRKQIFKSKKKGGGVLNWDCDTQVNLRIHFQKPQKHKCKLGWTENQVKHFGEFLPFLQIISNNYYANFTTI